MDDLTVIRELDLATTPLNQFSAVYLGDARRPLAEARICAAKFSDQVKPKYLLIDIGRKPDQDTWELISAAVHRLRVR